MSQLTLGSSMTRKLTPEERKLWREATRSILRHRRKGIDRGPIDTPPKSPLDDDKAGRIETPPLSKFVQTNLDNHTLRRLAKGRLPIDDILDLHGYRLSAAYDELAQFLQRNHALGSKIVLIITGKGSSGASAANGALRKNTPKWLSAPKLREFVTSFDEADARHGGSGALYVRIRSSRPRSA